jgi:hypothetical protein
MKIAKTILAGCLFLLLGTQRSPAPIEEEKPPSPTPIQGNSPSATAGSQLSRQEAARFAGTWTGKIKFGNTSDAEFTFIINLEATSLIQKYKRLGESAHPTTVTDGTISWTTGAKDAIKWTLTPNADGQTALVKMKPISVEESTATFQRTETPAKHGRAGARPKAHQ